MYKRGCKTDAQNYHPVSVIGPLANLYTCCLSLSLETQASLHGWHAPTQAGLRRHYRLEDLLIPVDYILARAQARKLPLVLCLVDLEKVYDIVPHDRLLHLLDAEYGVGVDMLETIRRILINTRGKVPDG